MKNTGANSPGMPVAGTAAILFGGATIISGGHALFGGQEALAAVGNAVPFVLWFNFAAGFAYLIAGIGLLMRRKWVAWLSGALAVATVLVFAAFTVHIQQGGAYEMRTVGAMALRSVFWLSVAVFAHRHFRSIQ